MVTKEERNATKTHEDNAYLNHGLFSSRNRCGMTFFFFKVTIDQLNCKEDAWWNVRNLTIIENAMSFLHSLRMYGLTPLAREVTIVPVPN